jgi:hypothetical protein
MTANSPPLVENGPLPAEEPAPARKKRWWLRLVLSFGVLTWLVWHTSWEPLLQLFAGMKLAYWWAAVGMYAGSQVVSSKRWQILARPLDFHAPLYRYVALYFLGMFFSLFLPTSIGGDVVRAWMLAGEKRRRGAAFLSVVSERFSGLVALVLLALVAALCQRELLPWWMTLTVIGLAAGLLGGLALLPLLKKHSAKLKSLAEALSLRRQHQAAWWAALGLAFIVQIASVFLIALAGMALGLEVPLLGYAVVVPLVSLLAMLPLSLNGLGIREGSLILMLAPFGVPAPAAVALGLAWFALTLALGAVGGLIYLVQGFTGPSSQEHDAHATLDRDPDQGRVREPATAA